MTRFFRIPFSVLTSFASRDACIKIVKPSISGCCILEGSLIYLEAKSIMTTVAASFCVRAISTSVAAEFAHYPRTSAGMLRLPEMLAFVSSANLWIYPSFTIPFTASSLRSALQTRNIPFFESFSIQNLFLFFFQFFQIRIFLLFLHFFAFFQNFFLHFFRL